MKPWVRIPAPDATGSTILHTYLLWNCTVVGMTENKWKRGRGWPDEKHFECPKYGGFSSEEGQEIEHGKTIINLTNEVLRDSGIVDVLRNLIGL